MKFKMNILITVIMISFIYSCSDSVNQSTENSYYPGEVFVAFKDTVSYPFIKDFVDEIQLEIKRMYIDSSFTIWIIVENGANPDQVIEKFSAYTYISWIEHRGGYDNGRPVLIAQYHPAITVEDAVKQIKNTRNISVDKVMLGAKNVLLKVKVGEENYWAEKLKLYPFIAIAGVNTINYVH